jgi:hypothetical protein
LLPVQHDHAKLLGRQLECDRRPDDSAADDGDIKGFHAIILAAKPRSTIRVATFALHLGECNG